MNVKVIGVGGFARAGKDSFVNIAKNILTANGYWPVRVAFADDLKNEVKTVLTEYGFPYNVYTDDAEEKTKIRPLLVWWGCARRDTSEEGMYWVRRVENKILDNIKEGLQLNADKKVFLINDVRFPTEVKWVHDRWQGWFVHLRRYTEKVYKNEVGETFEKFLAFPGEFVDGTRKVKKIYDDPPNEEEAKQDPLIRDMADYHAEWCNRGNLASDKVIEDPYLQAVVLKALNECPYFSESKLKVGLPHPNEMIFGAH